MAKEKVRNFTLNARIEHYLEFDNLGTSSYLPDLPCAERFQFPIDISSKKYRSSNLQVYNKKVRFSRN